MGSICPNCLSHSFSRHLTCRPSLPDSTIRFQLPFLFPTHLMCMSIIALISPCCGFSLYSLTYTLNSESENMTTSCMPLKWAECQNPNPGGSQRDRCVGPSQRRSLLTIPKQRGPNRWRERTQILLLPVPFALAVPLAKDNASYKISSSYE